MEFYGIKYEEYKSFNNCRPKSYQLDYNPYIQIVHTVKKDLYGIFIEITIETDLENNNIYKTVSTYLVHISDISLTKHQDLIVRLINETINKHIKYTLSETGKNIPVLVYNERIRILLANAV